MSNPEDEFEDYKGPPEEFEEYKPKWFLID